MFKRVPGTKDILPEEANLWQRIEQIAADIFALYNYRQIRTPIIEEAGLFDRTLGATTEIVQKQMFLIHNQQDTYALRPEGTASIARSYIENNLDKTTGFSKLYYTGPMFRLERPQKGRLRQFHHIGCEAIGSNEASLDIETIALADQLLKGFGISSYEINLNSLGCPKDKENLSQHLKEELSKNEKDLCKDCQERIKKNVLRALDCKNEECQRIVKSISSRQSFLCDECSSHFETVKEGLKNLNIGYELNPMLVRGLDYYNRTVFEITHPQLGSQDAIGAGGRYNNLISELGGPDLGGIGFAFGMERLLLAQNTPLQCQEKKLVYLITLGDKARLAGLKILAQLRTAGICCDTDYLNKSLKGALRSANDQKAATVLILGDNELEKNIIVVKNMSESSQKEIPLDKLMGELRC